MAALVLFAGVIGPQLQGNSSTSTDNFRLAPTAMVLLLGFAPAGPAIIGVRAVALQRYSGERR